MKLCYKCQSYYDENLTDCPFCQKKAVEENDGFVYASFSDMDTDSPIPEADSEIPHVPDLKNSPEDNDIPSYSENSNTTDAPFEDNPITENGELKTATEEQTDNDISALLHSQFSHKTGNNAYPKDNGKSANIYHDNGTQPPPPDSNVHERDLISCLRSSVNTGGSMLLTVFDFIFLVLCLLIVPLLWQMASDAPVNNETLSSLMLSGFTVLLSVCFLKNTVYSLHSLIFTPLSVILIAFFSLIYGGESCFNDVLFVIPAGLCIQSLIILILSFIRKAGEKSIQTFLLYLLPLTALASVGLVSGSDTSTDCFLPIIFLITSSIAILISSVFEHFGLALLLNSAFPGTVSFITAMLFEDGSLSESVYLLINAAASFIPMLILCICLWAGLPHFPGNRFEQKTIFFFSLSVCQFFSLLLSFLFKEQHAYSVMDILTVLTQPAHLICLISTVLVNVTVYFMFDKFFILDFRGRSNK